MVKLSIIIVNFNTRDLLIQALESLAKQFINELKNGTIEIIVVDNHSSDGSGSFTESFKRRFGLSADDVKVIINNENYGFAKGNNIGVNHAIGTYVLLLNSDTLTLDRGFLSMVDYLEKNRNVGILGGKLLNENGSIQHSAAKFYKLFNALLFISGCERLGMLRSSPTIVKKVDWVSGACMMFEKEFFKSLGGFDEHIFMYLEDMELCFRAKQNGKLTYFFPQVQVQHKSHGSSNKAFAIVKIYEGLLYFYKKHLPLWQYNVLRVVLRIKAKIALNIGYISGNTYLTDAYGKALSKI